MAFSTRRGRPRKPVPSRTDKGTPELQQKHRIGLTVEPLDLLLKQNKISPEEHRAGMHFRWLHALCHGVPWVSSPDLTAACGPGSATPRHDDPLWRSAREADYRTAACTLQEARLMRVVLNCCIYHDVPADAGGIERLRAGLALLLTLWRRF